MNLNLQRRIVGVSRYLIYATLMQCMFLPVSRAGNIKAMENTRDKPMSMEISNTYFRDTESPDVEVTGKVTDENGEGLPGATVMVKGTNKGTTSDFEGNFSLSIPDGATLVISFVGYITREIEVGNQTTINVQMALDAEQLDEIIVVGYGTQEKSDITGAVIRADIATFKHQANTDLAESLQGRVPGLNIGVSRSAGDSPDFGIRGTNNLNSDANAPLIVVDGTIFRGNLSDINPNDIATIDILKDASSAAVYGSQAANGVIVVTTKSGKAGGGSSDPVFSYSSKISLREDANYLDYYDGEGYLKQISDFDWMLSYPQGPKYDPNYSPLIGLNPPEYDGYVAGAEIDWPSLITRKGILNQHDIGVTGGSESVSYFVSTGYTNQKDVLIGDDYERITGRVNLELKLTDWLKFGTNSFISIADYSGIEYGRGQGYTLSPFSRPYDDNGVLVPHPNGQLSDNPLLVGDNLDSDKRMRMNSLVYAIVDIPWVKGLTYRANYNNSYRTQREDRFSYIANNNLGEARKDFYLSNDWTFDNILNYKGSFGDHDIGATFVYGREEEYDEATLAEGDNFTNTVLGYHSLQSAELEKISSSASEQSSIYNLVRLTYSFQDKYNLTLTGRRDGFSGFGSNNKTAFFPSAAVAWHISDEAFFESMSDVVSNLKIRASYGQVGNRGVQAYQTLASVITSDAYVFGEGSGTFIGQEFSRLASPSLKWEETTGLNLGLDYSILEGKIQGSVEYYNTSTTNQLFSVGIPGINGFTSQLVNIGQIDNHGIEFNVSSTNITKGEFSWKTAVVFSLNRNEIVSILGEDADGDGIEDDILDAGIFIGEDAGAVFNYNIIGMYQIGDDLPSNAYEPGYFKIEDVNNDGAFDSNDKTVIGSTQPSYRFGITNTLKYKNFSFSFFINSIQGGKNRYLGFNTPWLESNWDDFQVGKVQGNRPKIWDYWTPDNPNSEYPSLRYFAPESGLEVYKSRSFIRLQDVTFSYSLERDIASKLGLNDLIVVLGGKNLGTLTKWKGKDPEVAAGIDSARPVIRSYTFGLNMSF